MRKIVFDFKETKRDEIPIQDNNGGHHTTQKDSIEEMFDYINNIMGDENYGIGLHSLHKGDREDILNSIMENGLEIEERKKILSTVSSFGTHAKISREYLKQQMMQYSYGKQENTKQNVIVLVPSTISNSHGEQIYLGFPPYDIECHGNDFRTSCVLDTICAGKESKGKIPPEFILGYYTSSDNGVNFIKNPNYFKFLSEEQKDVFFKNMESRLQGQYKRISDAVIAKDIQTLEEMSKNEQLKIAEEIKKETRINILERGVNRQLAETLSRSSVQIKQDDSATQALGYVEREIDKEQQVMQPIGKKKRKILLYAYQGVKLSDLTGAKATLREGIEQPQKNYEGKEI